MSERVNLPLINEKELKKMEEKITSQMEPFLDGIRTKRGDYELFKRAYADSIPRLVGGMELFDFITKDFAETTQFRAKEEIHWLFAYLGLIESLGNCIIDRVVMLLVANGRDFHIECRYTTPRIKHVTSIKDLEEERVPLTTKLHFLKDNGVTELALVVDSELRNAIAHLRFNIRGDRVFFRKKPAYLVLANSIKKLVRALPLAWRLTRQLAEAGGVKTKMEEIQ